MGKIEVVWRLNIFYISNCWVSWSLLSLLVYIKIAYIWCCNLKECKKLQINTHGDRSNLALSWIMDWMWKLIWFNYFPLFTSSLFVKNQKLFVINIWIDFQKKVLEYWIQKVLLKPCIRQSLKTYLMVLDFKKYSDNCQKWLRDVAKKTFWSCLVAL